MSSGEPLDLARRIDAITAYLPLFEGPGDAIGRWAGGERDANGTWMPWFEYSPEVLAFMRACAGNGWVEVFEWPAWQAEAVRYVDEPSRLD